MLVIGVVMTESGRQFHVLTILNANEFSLFLCVPSEEISVVCLSSIYGF